MFEVVGLELATSAENLPTGWKVELASTRPGLLSLLFTRSELLLVVLFLETFADLSVAFSCADDAGEVGSELTILLFIVASLNIG